MRICVCEGKSAILNRMVREGAIYAKEVRKGVKHVAIRRRSR